LTVACHRSDYEIVAPDGQRREQRLSGLASIMAKFLVLRVRKTPIALGLLTFVLLLGAILIAKSPPSAAMAGGVLLAGSETTAVTPQSASTENHPARVDAERLVVHRYGFEPAEINRPHGKFLLALDNRSGADELDLQLFTQHGSASRQVRLSGDKSRWREVLNLPPGTYLLTEAGHPQWQCRITITPR
jgi:hypothetical protein